MFVSSFVARQRPARSGCNVSLGPLPTARLIAPPRHTSPMTTSTAPGRRPRRFTAELREQETVKPLELYFDLVFVLGFTQCTALMSANPSWTSVAQGMLVLAVLWW